MDDLEKTIADLIERKNAAPEGSAEYCAGEARRWRACATATRWRARSWKTWTRLSGAASAAILALPRLIQKDRCCRCARHAVHRNRSLD